MLIRAATCLVHLFITSQFLPEQRKKLFLTNIHISQRALSLFHSVSVVATLLACVQHIGTQTKKDSWKFEIRTKIPAVGLFHLAAFLGISVRRTDIPGDFGPPDQNPWRTIIPVTALQYYTSYQLIEWSHGVSHYRQQCSTLYT